MKRRTFIKKSSLAAAAGFVLPTILPTGRLFAATGARRVNHVVFCLFAGGVRNLESVHMADGNLMPYSLAGSAPISNDIIGGLDPLPVNTGLPLQNSGTLFKEFRYAEGPTGHYAAHVAAVTGNYIVGGVERRKPPPFPTIFELYRKHNTPAMTATNAWWIVDSLGPFPYLHFSEYEGYGPLYGANMIQPTSLFNDEVDGALGNPKAFDPEDYTIADGLRGFFDKQFDLAVAGGGTIENTLAEQAQLQAFLKQNMNDNGSGAHNDPWGAGFNTMNNDMWNMFYATKVLEEFKPELLVVNMQGVDACHSNFTQYCNNMAKSDFALAKLWETIQATPGMANDTVLIAVPEHGRNQDPNTIIDPFGRYAIDHTSDDMSREIFCLVLGPSGVVVQNQAISAVQGESIDVVPTIANLLGFDSDVPSGMLPGRFLQEAFV